MFQLVTGITLTVQDKHTDTVYENVYKNNKIIETVQYTCKYANYVLLGLSLFSD